MDSLSRISWIDSCGMPSRIHLTLTGTDTLCGGHAEYIACRELTRSPKRRHGYSNFCRVCFQGGGKSLPWDERCSTAE